MPTKDEIEAAALALALLNTAPGHNLLPGLWMLPARRALEAAETVRSRADPVPERDKAE